MSKTRCIIVDDEPVAIRILEKHLSAFSSVEIVATFHLATQALEFLRNQRVDLILLDINMPRMTGMDLIRTLQHPPAVILTTAYRDYAVEAYDLDVVDYLVKPISLERMAKALQRYYERKNTELQPLVPGSQIYVSIKTSSEIVRLKMESLYYIESMGDYVVVFHEGGKLVSRNRISQLEEEWHPHLVRVHRRYLVAIHAIDAIMGNVLKVKDQQIPIGRTYRPALTQVLNEI